jgi:CHAD domain-containing protein
VRDADVLGGRLQARAASHLAEEDRPGFDELLGRLALQRQAARMRLLEVLDSERYLDLLDSLSEAVEHPPFQAGAFDPSTPARGAVIPLVRQPWEKLRKAVAGLGSQADNQALHQIRIKAKRTRYAAEAAAVAVGKKARRFAKAVAALQDVLGDQHDAVTAEGWLRGVVAVGAVGEVFVAGQLVTVERNEQDELRGRWPSAWQALDNKRLTSWLR